MSHGFRLAGTLILAANRDEFHRRPASPLQWWPDLPQIAAGRDLEAGGGWLAAGRSGGFATFDNYRETLAAQLAERSRGELVTSFVTGNLPPLEVEATIDGNRYTGLNLLAATPEAVAYVSNRGAASRLLAPKRVWSQQRLPRYALAKKWQKSRQRLQSLLDQNTVMAAAPFGLLAGRERAADADMPN